MSEKPELGDLRIGDEVNVRNESGSHTVRYVRARVVKVSRVWIDLEPLDGYLHETRFRRDNQTAKARPEHWTPYFRTDEQVAWEQRRTRAHEYLREIGVHADPASRFAHDALGLANAIRRGLGEDEL